DFAQPPGRCLSGVEGKEAGYKGYVGFDFAQPPGFDFAQPPPPLPERSLRQRSGEAEIILRN
ncbi:MAG: hypothetical protein LWX70_05515, partial [Sphingobacteriia bacterium]|nr:hypothetical protein [Sphingobacteriia bacterium]